MECAYFDDQDFLVSFSVTCEMASAMVFSHSANWTSNRPFGGTNTFSLVFQTFFLREIRRHSSMEKGSNELGRIMEGRFEMGMGMTLSSSMARYLPIC